MSAAFQIRLATTDDIPALSALIPLAARGLSGGFYTPAQTESAIRHIFGVDSQLIADQTYLVATINGRIVGCGGWSKRQTLFGGDQMKSQVDPLLDPSRDPARVRAFFVHPDFARRGIGSAILDACESAARKAGFTRVELIATLPGEPLYSARGYRVVERFDVPLPDEIQVPVARMTKSVE